ncbi:MAG TPA: tetratricopeptide repeat protein [Alloacidobacterium sp.]|nr:tetratricopeptide repeat protein [Alloacidobacterium sp.]
MAAWISLSVPGQESKPSVAMIESLIRAQQYSRALDATRSALHDSPRDFRLWTLEGIVLSMEGNKQSALAAFDKALALSPKYAAALKGKVEILYELQDKRAIPALKEILSADPGDATAHEMLALLETKQGNCETANEHFLASADAIQNHSGSLESYGYCLMQARQPEKAIPVFERLMALHPESTDTKYDLAIAQVEAQRYTDALKILEPLLASTSQDADILSLASEAYEGAGNTPKAVELLRQAIVVSPSTASYYVSFATLCLDHESFQVGIDMLDAGLKHISDDPSLYIARGLLYAQLSKFDQAEADFKQAEKLDSTQSLSAYGIDLTEIAKNNVDQALQQTRSQLKAHPESPQLHFMLAKLLSERSSATDNAVSNEAIAAAKAALKLKPDMVGARDLLADIYIRSGQYNLAIEQSRASLKYSPADQSAIYHLIIALRHSGPDGQREMQQWVKQLTDLKQASRQKETEQKHFRLVEVAPPAAK